MKVVGISKGYGQFTLCGFNRLISMHRLLNLMAVIYRAQRNRESYLTLSRGAWLVTPFQMFDVAPPRVTAIKLRKNYDKVNTYVDKSPPFFQRGGLVSSSLSSLNLLLVVFGITKIYRHLSKSAYNRRYMLAHDLLKI